jgi:hypothetical protein
MRIPADRWIAYYKLELKITAQDQLNLSTGQTCAKTNLTTRTEVLQGA